MRHFRTSLLGLSIAGMILSGPLQAAQPPSSTVVKRQLTTERSMRISPKVVDVQLGDGGTFHAKLVSVTGQPLSAQNISLTQAGRLVIAAPSSNHGELRVRNVQGGLYQVQFGDQATLARLWTADAAPPTAVPKLLLIKKSAVQRAQCGNGSCDGSCGGTCDEEVICADGCGDAIDGPNPFCGMFGQEPLMIGLLVAAAIAIPIAVHNSGSDPDGAS